ncbi:glycerophosphoryl diester phosphodiesterase [Streptosporangium violaceochromogenes]|nr:glycerophosphoryl diester phosphodiesterase [Streptosporangium violaceochromogenes]
MVGKVVGAAVSAVLLGGGVLALSPSAPAVVDVPVDGADTPPGAGAAKGAGADTATGAGVVPKTGTGAAAGTDTKAGGARCSSRRPIVIAHRGASAFRPEHTLAAYRLAVRMGADYIETDLVSTKDHVLVARHENELSKTTDVAGHPEFAGRRTTRRINGHLRTGWFTEDFTLDELRTLRARERFPKRRPHSKVYDGQASIPTLEEIVRLARRHGVGLYPEIKYSTYFASIGLPIEGPLLATLARHGWKDRDDPVFIQSFETWNLRELRPVTRLRLTQLIGARGAPYDLVAAGDRRTYRDLVTPSGLKEIATYADAVGVITSRIVPTGPDGRLGVPTSLVRDAHARGLQVHAATVRNENAGLPADYRRGDPARPAYRRAAGDVAGWLRRLYTFGVDGVFANDPVVARAVRDRVCAGG